MDLHILRRCEQPIGLGFKIARVLGDERLVWHDGGPSDGTGALVGVHGSWNRQPPRALHVEDALRVLDFQAVAPGLYPTFPKARYVIRRRKGDKLSSCFTSVWHAFVGDAGAGVRSIRRLAGGGSVGRAPTSW